MVRQGALSAQIIDFLMRGSMNDITMETRREGMEYIEPKAGEIAARVLEHLKGGAATAGEIAAATGISLNNVRSRLTESLSRQRVVTVGKKLNPETGVRVAVWAVVP